MFQARKTSIVAAFLVLGILTAVFMPATFGRTKSYYSGDAINFDGKVVVATANTGAIELFVKEGGTLVRKGVVRSNETYNKNFVDVMLAQEDGRLYAYAVNGNFYKFDITKLESPTQVWKKVDPSWDWYFGVAKSGDRLVTLGSKTIKFWNHSPDVVDSYPIKVKNGRSVAFSQDGNYMYIVEDDRLVVKDLDSRLDVLKKDVSTTENHNRAMHVVDDRVYLADDKNFSAIRIDGSAQYFDHISTVGYETSGINGARYVYFTDGIGIVKIDRETMKAVDWNYTTKMGAMNGWAMGLKAVATDKGDNLVIFNGSTIIILDKNLKLSASFKATEEDVYPTTELYIKLDKNRGAAGTQFALDAGGFQGKEEITVDLCGQRIGNVLADADGLTSATLTVPNFVFSKPKLCDIKLTGVSSKLTWSTTFTAE